MGKVKIKQVIEKDPGRNDSGVVDPILVRFQHAQGSRQCSSMDLNEIFKTAVFTSDPANLAHKDFSHLNRRQSQMDGEKARRVNRKGTQMVALQSSSMTYIGTNNVDEPVRTYLGLRKGKKMKVYEVTPITVSPFIKGHSFVVEKEKQTQIKKSQSEKKAAAVDLIKSFGSKMKRLTHERMEKNQIAVADMDESMTKAFSQMQGSEEEPQVKDESVLSLIPPCNREATTPEGVYNLADVITPKEMGDMDELADQFLNLDVDLIRDWQANKIFSDYFFAMWNRLSTRKNDGKAVYCAKLVLYTELLICLLKLRHEQIRRKLLVLPDVFPTWLQEKALESFTSVNAKGMRNRSDVLKDKTCCYIIVLVLLANDFVFDVQLMSTSLHIHIKKLLTLAKAVGISLHYNSTTKENRGVLKLPLPKPIETRGRRRALR